MRSPTRTLPTPTRSGPRTGRGEFLPLVETLAETVASALMAEFAVPWLRIRLDKPGAVPGAQGVGVSIERGVRRGQ
jgi:dihydroneopterin aldolase